MIVKKTKLIEVILKVSQQAMTVFLHVIEKSITSF